MKRRISLIVTVVAFVIMLPSIASAQNALRERLDKGEIVVKVKDVKGSDIPEATVTAVIDAPPQDVWNIVGDCSRYTKTMIRVLESEQIKKKGDQVTCKVTTDMPWPLSNLTALTQAKHVVGPPVWSRTWVLIKGDFESNRGSWRIQNFDSAGQRSLVVYKIHAVPDMLVPDGLITKAQRDTLPKLIEHLRKSLKKKK